MDFNINLHEVSFWWWWILAVILMVLETMVPGAFFLWMAVSAAIVGFLAWIIPSLDIYLAILLFSVFSVISVLAWRYYIKKNPTSTDQPTLNLRGAQYVERVLTLTHPIVNGRGKVKVDDSLWKIEGPDCPAGTKVRITGLKGTSLQVEIQKLPK